MTTTERRVPVPWSTASIRRLPSAIAAPGCGQVTWTVRVWPGSKSTCSSAFSTGTWWSWDPKSGWIVEVDVLLAGAGSVAEVVAVAVVTIGEWWLPKLAWTTISGRTQWARSRGRPSTRPAGARKWDTGPT